MSINKKCQVFTPPENVSQLLDAIEYSKNLYGKKIAESSCGDGNILVEIVDRYIKDCLKNGLDISVIKEGLENDIWAAEIDIEHIIKCKINLDNVSKKYNICDVVWNISQCDFLAQYIKNRFDFFVSNPPYITYRDLNIETRKFVKTNYKTCSVGKFDYCYAFIEAGIMALKDKGKLAYLIPSNIFKNQFALKLRNYILPHLTDIYDFKNKKIFTKHLTASAIIVCDMKSDCNKIRYHNLSTNITYDIEKKQLINKWIFTNTVNKCGDLLRFGEYFHAASSVATLLNKVYIISKFREIDNYLEVEGQKIEKEVLRKAVSPRSLYLQKKEYIIFPYSYDEDGQLSRYTIEDFEARFPETSKYLYSYQKELQSRTIDSGCKWFEYGRSQALSHMNKEKLLLSTLVTGKVKVSLWDNFTIPTSGIYIVIKETPNKYTLSHAQRILSSEFFLEYVRGIGIISSSSSFRITSKDINNFMFPSSLLDV